MATACEYSCDAIDSIVMKSAFIAASEDTSCASTSEPPSASERLVDGLEEAMSLISDMLKSSADVMEQFKSEWDVALTSYQIDIGVMDEEIERMAREQKRRKKKIQIDEGDDTYSNQQEPAPEPTGPEADHALNFHLRARDENLNDGSDIFMLPSDETEVEITLLPDEQRQPVEAVQNDTSSAATKGGSKGCRSDHQESRQVLPPTKKDEERARFDSVSSLLTKMQTFRDNEADLVKQLSDRDNGMTSLTLRERQDLEDQLEHCRAKQTQQVVASVTGYKPRFKASLKKAKQGSSSNKNSPPDLGLSLPAIEDILDDAVTGAVPGTGRKNTKVKTAHKGARPKRQKQPPKRGKTAAKASKGKGLILDDTNVSATVQKCLQDPDNFLAVHELEIEKPSSKRPEPVERSLSALVKCNTRPLNAMEMGRRNRVDT